jgi:hypothetical protein
MVRRNELRAGEVAVVMPPLTDAGLVFIGRIGTPWTDRLHCPRQGRPDGPLCTIELFEPWVAGLDGVAAYPRLEVLYWLHESRRDIVHQSPKNDRSARGVFSLRSPVRPNPSCVHWLHARHRGPMPCWWDWAVVPAPRQPPSSTVLPALFWRWTRATGFPAVTRRCM